VAVPAGGFSQINYDGTTGSSMAFNGNRLVTGNELLLDPVIEMASAVLPQPAWFSGIGLQDQFITAAGTRFLPQWNNYCPVWSHAVFFTKMASTNIASAMSEIGISPESVSFKINLFWFEFSSIILFPMYFTTSTGVQFHGPAVIAQSIMHHETTQKALEDLVSKVESLTAAVSALTNVPADAAAGGASSRRRTRVQVTSSQADQPSSEETPRWKILMKNLPMPLPLRSKQQLIDLHSHLGGSSGGQAKARVREFLMEIARVNQRILSFQQPFSSFSSI
jgi:hypothetical protein